MQHVYVYYARQMWFIDGKPCCLRDHRGGRGSRPTSQRFHQITAADCWLALARVCCTASRRRVFTRQPTCDPMVCVECDEKMMVFVGSASSKRRHLPSTLSYSLCPATLEPETRSKPSHLSCGEKRPGLLFSGAKSSLSLFTCLVNAGFSLRLQ